MTFALSFFVCEILVVILVFGRNTLTHFGYAVDLLIIGIQLHSEHKLSRGANFSRLLNLFRLWRLFRLFTSMVQSEKDRQSNELILLDKVRDQLRVREIEVSELKSEVDKEREARDAIESMLSSYKDEVDTLNEALRIAAMDIADVAQGDEEGGEYGEHGDDGDDGSSLNSEEDADEAAAGASGSSSNDRRRPVSKSAMMRAVMSDSLNFPSSAAQQGRSTKAAFLVHEDGTFERK